MTHPDERSKALQAFTQICAKYELRPTKELLTIFWILFKTLMSTQPREFAAL